jgi:hypothetical protein
VTIPLCHNARVVSVAVALCSACHGPATPPPPTPSAVATVVGCVRMLPHHDLSNLPPAAALSAPPSQFVAEITVDLSALSTRIAAALPTELAAGRGVDIGQPGQLTYAIHRGPLTLSMRDERLQLSTLLRGHAEVCKPLGLLGCVVYGSCDPAAHAEASIPLRLQPDYTMGQSRVSITVTRPCVLSALGYDATPMIQQRANQEAANVRAKINRAAPSLEPVARALWSIADFDSSPLGSSSLHFIPEQIVQGAAQQRDNLLVVAVGTRGIVIPTRSSQSPIAPERSLPSPTYVPNLEPGIVAFVPVLIDDAALSQSVSRALSGQTIRAGSQTVSITSVDTRRSRDAIVLLLTTADCGDLIVLARPDLEPDSHRIRFASVQMPADEISRVVQSLPGIDPSELARQIAAHSPLEPAIELDWVAQALDRRLLAAQPQDGPQLHITDRSARVHSMVVTDQGLVVWEELRANARMIVR